jgi:prepilin-type processing-associated H-X9-DG protein
VTTTSPDQNPQSSPLPDEIKEPHPKKRKSGSSRVLRLGYLGAFGVLCTFTGVICMGYSIGINPLVDWLADYAAGTGFVISVLTLFAVAVVFAVSLFKTNGEVIWSCIVIFIIILLSFAIVMPATGKLSNRYYREECVKHMQRVEISLGNHCTQFNGRLPERDWCDILYKKFRLEERFLCCRGQFSGLTDGGISSYALNDQVVGKVRSQIPVDTVIVFETDTETQDPQYSMTDTRRKILQYAHPEKYYHPTGKVKEGQWNQVGGVDIVSCSHHAGLGCNVLFADGHVEFVRKKDIPKLRWKPEGN